MLMQEKGEGWRRDGGDDRVGLSVCMVCSVASGMQAGTTRDDVKQHQ